MSNGPDARPTVAGDQPWQPPTQHRQEYGQEYQYGSVGRYVREQWGQAPTRPIRATRHRVRPVEPPAARPAPNPETRQGASSNDDSSAWQEFRNWSKKARWRRVVFASVVTLLILGLVSEEVPTVGAAVEYGITKIREPGVFERKLPEELTYKSGVRVVERNTTLDLSGWKRTSTGDLDADRKVSRGLSLNSFVVRKTEPGAKYFVHTVSSGSKTAPSIWCDSHPFRVIEADSQGSSKIRQWNVLVDISQEPDDRPFTVNLLVTFWNGFQTRDDWWGGFRVLHATEVATYKVIFPPGLSATNAKFRYKDITSDELVDLDLTDLSVSPEPLTVPVQTLTWKVRDPQPDRSYQIAWTWPDSAAAF
jgi:hypothetical protein